MQINKAQLSILIGWATVWFVIVLAWLLWAFTSIKQEDVPVISTNNIIEQNSILPQVCQNTIALMNCIISSDQLSWEIAIINQSYQQILSEWNILTDQIILEQSCTTQYQYMTNLTEQPYQSIIQSCL